MNVAASLGSGDAGVLNEALVVRPSYLIEREMPIQGESAPILERTIEAHALFVGRLRAAGVGVTVFSRPTSVPLLPSIGDIAVFFRDGAFLMRPTDPARRREAAAVEALFAELKIAIVGRIEAPGLLDGGDVIVAGHTAFVGVPQERRGLIGVPKAPHGNALGRAQLRSFATSMGLKTVEVPIAADVRRLRAVASLIDTETVLYASRVVDGAAFAQVRTIEVAAGEEYGAGVLALGRRRVIADLRFGGVVPLLRAAKFAVDAIDLGEFGKVGMTPSFLVAALKRD
jgi:dimethylargininase